MEVFTKPIHYKATLASKEKVTNKVFIARWALRQPRTINFAAGQFIMFLITPQISRAMTIASPPQEDGVITICQDVSPMGPGSQWMLNLKIGDTVEFTGPFGRFTAQAGSPRREVFVATGTGVAPFRSMLYDAKRNWNDRNRGPALYWGLRHEEDLFWQQEFRVLAESRASFGYYLTLSQPGPNWLGWRGHVNEHVFANETNLTGCTFYLCGHSGMIHDMEAALTARGVPKQQIKKDVFF